LAHQLAVHSLSRPVRADMSTRAVARLPVSIGATSALLGLAACGSPAVAPTARPTLAPTAAATIAPTPSAVPATTPTPGPAPTATVLASPLAVVGSQNLGIGPYTLGLVNAQGRVVATATADTPSGYVSESGPPITSSSDSRLYYEDGNTNIDYLTATGQTGVAFTVSRPTGAMVEFAVSPDDSKVAVALLTNWDGNQPFTSHMYLMAMGGGVQQTLFDGTSTSSQEPLTWPVGWNGNSLVVAQSLPEFFSGWPPTNGPCATTGAVASSSALFCASQVRVFDPANRTFGPILCGGGDETASGSPTVAGIICAEHSTANPQVWPVVSWTGVITSFGPNITLGCLLSPHGAVIACPSAIDRQYNAYKGSNPAQLFRAGGVVQKIPHPNNAQIIGWLDGNDVVVTTGATNTGLAVENIVTGRQIPFSLPKSPNPYQAPWGPWQYFAAIPGGL
jgi:hypothetical protein